MPCCNGALLQMPCCMCPAGLPRCHPTILQHGELDDSLMEEITKKALLQVRPCDQSYAEGHTEGHAKDRAEGHAKEGHTEGHAKDRAEAYDCHYNVG